MEYTWKSDEPCRGLYMSSIHHDIPRGRSGSSSEKKMEGGGGRRSLTPSHVAVNSARRYTEPEGK